MLVFFGHMVAECYVALPYSGVSVFLYGVSMLSIYVCVCAAEVKGVVEE